jgi:pyruvate,orthophosphate dikinase
VHHSLLEAAALLETTGRDVQDIEFTVEAGTLWLLQSRSAKRSPDAAVRLAVALHDDGVADAHEALHRVTPEQVAAVCRPRITPEARAAAKVVARGEAACPGVASGRVVADVDTAESLADEIDVVLARPTTDPDDVPGMIVSAAILTEIGGSTSHAAVVSRELGTPCVVGCGAGSLAALVGTEVTVDGSTGEVFAGRVPLTSGDPEDNPALARLLEWARERVPGHPGGPAELVAAAQAATRSARPVVATRRAG